MVPTGKIIGKLVVVVNGKEQRLKLRLQAIMITVEGCRWPATLQIMHAGRKIEAKKQKLDGEAHILAVIYAA